MENKLKQKIAKRLENRKLLVKDCYFLNWFSTVPEILAEVIQAANKVDDSQILITTFV